MDFRLVGGYVAETGVTGVDGSYIVGEEVREPKGGILVIFIEIGTKIVIVGRIGILNCIRVPFRRNRRDRMSTRSGENQNVDGVALGLHVKEVLRIGATGSLKNIIKII